MEKTLQVLNRMEAEGVVGRYAIGGAVAATFYVEPVATFDLDIFFTAEAAAGEFVSLTPLYEFLSALGYEPTGEAVEIEGWPVQFLPVFDPLLEEALARAAEIRFKSTTTRVMRAEHLIAVMLQTGRAKDHARVIQFLEEGAVELPALAEVLDRHGLTARWDEFGRRFKL